MELDWGGPRTPRTPLGYAPDTDILLYCLGETVWTLHAQALCTPGCQRCPAGSIDLRAQCRSTQTNEINPAITTPRPLPSPPTRGGRRYDFTASEITFATTDTRYLCRLRLKPLIDDVANCCRLNSHLGRQHLLTPPTRGDRALASRSHCTRS